MDESRNTATQFLAVGAGLMVLGYLLAKAFADQIGVDTSAAGRLLFSIALSIGLIGYAVWSELIDSLIGLRALFPLALATLWSGLWPAMQFWGAEPFYFSGLPIERQHVAWWASSWMQWGGMAVLLIGGYAIAYWTWKRL